MEKIDVSTDDLIQSVTNVEKLGDEIVADRHSIVDMDRIRNKNREALGFVHWINGSVAVFHCGYFAFTFRSCLKRPSELTQNEEFVWMNIGDLLIRSSKENLTGILENGTEHGIILVHCSLLSRTTSF